MVSLAESTIPQCVVPLTDSERLRLGQLERTVEKNLSAFIQCGLALMEIREKRLYRTTNSNFADYCRERFALARSTVDQVIRSAATAQQLIDHGAQLPANTSEAVIRPLSALPSPELQSAAWRLIETASPQCGPTQPVAAKICRTIANAIEPAGQTKGHKLRKCEHTERETPFLRPVQRLAAYRGFDAALVSSHIERLAGAMNVYSACTEMIDRCRQVQMQLAQRFPDLANHV
jgi:hypothetical protein